MFSMGKAEALFQVVKPQFSSGVTRDASYSVIDPAKDGKISRSTLRKGNLFFSFTVQGGDKALEYLQDKGQLEVFTQPFGGLGGVIAGRKSDIGIQPSKWLEKQQAWTDQFAEEGFFTYRTLMSTNKTTETTTITVIVKDGMNNTIGEYTVQVDP
jgi:hypothetical protein